MGRCDVRPARASAVASLALVACTLAFTTPATAAPTLADGWKQYLAGQYDESIATAREAIRESTRELEWRLLILRALFIQGQTAKLPGEIEALESRYPHSLRALVLIHDLHRRTGNAARAKETLTKVQTLAATGGRPVDAPDLVASGQAALLLGGEPRAVLSEYFEPAVKKDPSWREAYLAAGTLALDKHDAALGAEWFRRGAKRVGPDPDLLHGLARAHLDGDRKEVIRALDAALQINPRHVPSLLLRAEHEIDSENYVAAKRALERALAVDGNRPEAWAYHAVLAHLGNDGKGEARAHDRALQRNAFNPEVDHLVGRKLSDKYRFTEGAAYQRRALKLDDGYLPAKIQLAQDLLRLGEDREGWALAEDVHKHDGYDVGAFNLVNLKAHLGKFETRKNTEFVLRMDPREAQVFADDVMALLREAKTTLDKKYGFHATRPAQVEIFPEQSDFAVRTFGMPGGAGFLGVCFGNLITANSPAGNVGTTFNWKAVLWHEYTHVITLGLSHNRMPRWLSEGISVFEELQRDPTWGQHMTPRYRQMVLGGELKPVGQLSGAFLNPKSGEHVMFAYYQSALVVEFLVGRYGPAALTAILNDLGAGTGINQALASRTAPLPEFEKGFEAFARKRAETVPDARKLVAAADEARRLLEDGEWRKAKDALERSIALYPEQKGEGNAYLGLATAHRKLGDKAAERATLVKLAESTSDAMAASLRLMELADESGDMTALAKYSERAFAVNPMSAAVQRALGRVHEARAGGPGGDRVAADRAVANYRNLLRLEPTDPADVNYRLAKLLKVKDPRAARRHILDALAEAPRFRPAHKLLLEMSRP